MKRNEAIERQIQAWKIEDRDDDKSDLEFRVVPRLKKLPEKLRNIGMAIFGFNETGKDLELYSFDDEDEAKVEADLAWKQKWQSQIDSLSAGDRKKIFAVLAKDLADPLEATWQYLKQAPYHGLFRAPNNPEQSLESRIDWLENLGRTVSGFREEVLTLPWLAAWASLAIPHSLDEVTPLLVAAMNGKGKIADEVFDILYKTVTREHPTAVMSSLAIESLLGAEREKGWELIEKTLLAAQRQEGLRHTIVESAGRAHPQAFLRIVRLIVSNDLIRFSSVARTIDVWLCLLWDSASTKVLKENVEAILTFLESPDLRKKALASDDAETVYRALWCYAYQDAVSAVKLAKGLLKHPKDEIRYVAVWILTLLNLKQATAAKAAALGDSHLQVAVLAAINLDGINGDSEVLERLDTDDFDESNSSEYFEALESLYNRLPEKPETLKAIVWPWTARKIQRSNLSQLLLHSLGNREPIRLIPYLKGLDSWEQSKAIRMLAKPKKWDAKTRSTMMELAGHSSSDVRSVVFEFLEKQSIQEDEYLILESYLSRTASDLRQSVVGLILKQSDTKALASARRLTSAKDGKTRLAGLEVVRQLAEGNRARKNCQEIGVEYRAKQKKLSPEEEVQLREIEQSDKASLTMENALGLLNPEGRTKVIVPAKKKIPLITKAAVACVKALDDLVHENRKVTVKYKRWRSWEEEPLGEVGWGLPIINLKKPLPTQLNSFPLWSTWSEWKSKRSASLKDKDGLELLRALAFCEVLDAVDDGEWTQFVKKPDEKKSAIAVLGEFDIPKVKYLSVVRDVIRWLFFSEVPKGCLDYLLDCVENTGANVPDAMHQDPLPANVEKKKKSRRGYWDEDEDDWRHNTIYKIWPELLSSFVSYTAIKQTDAQIRRDYELVRYWDEPIPGAKRSRVGLVRVAQAFQKKYATMDDLVDELLGPSGESYDSFGELRQATERHPRTELKEAIAKTKGLPELLDKIRETLLQVELSRGEKPTVSSEAILSVGTFYGSETLFSLIRSLNGKFKVLSGWQSEPQNSRQATFTELIKSTYPRDNETANDFIKHAKKAMTDGFFSEEQLLELAFLAPQWSKFAGELLGWEGFSEGLYWFLAHMSTWMSDAAEAAAQAEGLVDDEQDDDDDFDEDDDDDDENEEGFRKEKLTAWEKLILERTPLSSDERREGAVDVDWFHRTFALLGEKRWKQMASSAKLAANSSQAKKAQFLADALLGNTPRKDLVEGIKKRNLKENVRLLGLLPLADGAKRSTDLLERYQVLLEYKKYASKLSSLTKPEAMRAFEIGISNLARQAGYSDPLRLEWALEGESIKDLAKGPVSVTKDGVTVILQLDEDAKPQLLVRKGDKALKSVPAPLKKKHAAIADLAERATDLRKKTSRMKQSLEAAMCRGDSISSTELLSLMQHPILAPQLKRIVMIGDGIAGYPDKDGKVLRDHQGKLEPIKKDEALRIAHSSDLLKRGDWDKWQHDCFHSERVQPFKQIFRELYVPTKQEKGATFSTRFSGHQIGPKQAMALWNSRGWNTQDEVLKIFYDLSLVANVSFQYDYGTAAEIEGLTVEQVTFHNRDTYKSLKMGDVPQAVFSEVMRDIDLVVSVAHRGEVDPEASESTVEMRASLIRETCQLLGLKNVKLKASHAVIDGYYGDYSLHLGSGGIQRMPGGALAILPVHAQHRGRLFLPFADDDPKTAEIVSKVLLLAKDEEIMDPTILDQLGAPVKKRPPALQADQVPSAKASDSKKSADTKAKSGKTKGEPSSIAANIAAMVSGKRRFEFVEGSSNKFWEIECSGKSVTTTWGRIGTAGQSKTKDFASEAKAQEEYRKLVEEKTGKGYKEVP